MNSSHHSFDQTTTDAEFGSIGSGPTSGFCSCPCCLGCDDDFRPRRPSESAPSGTPDTSGGQPNPPAAPAAHLTREDVYQQLVRAEKDGSLDRLNATVYFP